MWRLYGHQGKGVGIVFSVANNPERWRDFHLSKIIYGADNRTNFKKLLDAIDSLNHTKPTIGIDFGKIYAFHKSRLFLPEAEVRLLFDRRQVRAGMRRGTASFMDQQIFPIIKTDPTKPDEIKEKVRYLELPIYHHTMDVVDADTPLLKIDQILFGYQFGKEAKQMIREIEQQSIELLGYKPIVKQTRLRKFYWDVDLDKEG